MRNTPRRIQIATQNVVDVVVAILRVAVVVEDAVPLIDRLPKIR